MYRFTDISIESLPAPATGRKDYWERPLGVRVTSKGTKSYMVMIGSGKRHMLGRVGAIPLKDARQQALRLKADYQPTKYKAPALQLSEARTRYLAAITVRTPTRRYYERFLAQLPDLPLAEIDHTHIIRILDRHKPSQQYVALRTYSAFFRWCIPRWLKHSPCTGLKVPALPSRSRVLSDEELGRIWGGCLGSNALAPQGDINGSLPTSFCRIVQLLMLTGMRRTECSLIEKSWINEKEKTLTIPASVTKNGRKLVLPLGPTSASLLTTWWHSISSLDPSQKLLFATSSTSSKKTVASSKWSRNKAALDKASGVTDWVLHTLRHTYRSNLARIRCPPHIAERLVNHVSSQTVLQRIYDHHTHADEMREWQEKYEDFFTTKIITNA